MYPPLPDDELPRREALFKLRMLDTPAEERFDRITRIASALFCVPIALVSLVDAHRQWFKSRQGLEVSETPRSISFCGHAILAEGPFVIENALLDERFADNPLVTGELNLRFYAGMPLKSIDGHSLGTLCLIDREPRYFSNKDVTLLRDLAAWAELELNLTVAVEQKVAELRNTFVKLVSHELRGPMTSVVGAIDMLRSSLGANAPLEQLTDIAASGALRLNRLVDNIVGLAELDTMPRALATQTVDVSDFVAAALESFADQAAAANITLRKNLPEGLEVVTAMRPLVKILRHLIDNAIRFSPAGGTVIVTAASIHERYVVRIAVDDDGPGIPAEEVSRLFGPFTQANTADNRSVEGAGLGLSLAHRLSIAIGGRLGYEVRPNGGSRFYLELPPQTHATAGQ